MKQGLFNKMLEPRCAYCSRGSMAPTGTEFLCPVKGLVQSNFSCKKFDYDPLKRQPKNGPKLPDGFTASDFSL